MSALCTANFLLILRDRQYFQLIFTNNDENWNSIKYLQKAWISKNTELCHTVTGISIDMGRN